jgi:septal ring factor EnvC (AmiA/AmiB activator)
MVAGGTAVAASLSAAEATTTSPDATIGDLQDRLAALQGETADLTTQVAAAGTALKNAQAAAAARAQAARLAAAQAARQASVAWSAPARPVTHKVTHTTKHTTPPVTHTTTGASGAGSEDDGHEGGGSDD